jgi:hypothetical protein
VAFLTSPLSGSRGGEGLKHKKKEKEQRRKKEKRER